MTQPEFRITNGPGKFDLMLSVFEGKRLKFTLQDVSQRVCVAAVDIHGVDLEDGSFESWCIEGYMIDLDGQHLKHNGFTGYYHTRDRHGWLTKKS